jgi:hypothetical protein
MFVAKYTFDTAGHLIVTTVEGRRVHERRMREYHHSAVRVPLYEAIATRRTLTRAEAAAIRAGTQEILK